MNLLCVQSLGKSFKTYRSGWHRIASWIGLSKPIKEHWALKNLNFNIELGQSVGIVGVNGAGKSTLLKIVTNTMKPTEGNIEVTGRIHAILELGMGFNPDLTGRQNIIYTAGLMGLSRRQILELIPKIEDFAEIGKYFDEPLRTYSSGMQVRLAFSVATAIRPEILIIDEALAVGDSYFQHKSYNRIREFQKNGTTLLIVSHDRSAIIGLCNRAILLENGSIIKDGVPEEVMDYYNSIIAEKEGRLTKEKILDNGKVQITSGSGKAKVTEINLYNSKGIKTDYISVGEKVSLQIKVKICQNIDALVLGYSIKDRLGQVIFGTNTWHIDKKILSPEAGAEYLYSIEFQSNLGIGSYSLQTALVSADTHLSENYEWRDLAFVFNVINTDKNYFEGCLWSNPRITISPVNT